MSYELAGELGAMRDSFALIRAALADDREAVQVLLDQCDLREVALTLASYAATATEAGCGGKEAATAWLERAQAAMTDAEVEAGGQP